MKRRDSLNSLPAPSLCARSPAERSSYRDRNLGDLYDCDQPVENRCGIYLMHASIGQHGDEAPAGRDEHFSTLFEAAPCTLGNLVGDLGLRLVIGLTLMSEKVAPIRQAM